MSLRILFAFVGGRGHLGPLLPIAGAAAAVGHTVAITGRPDLVAPIRAAGFDAFATAPGTGDPPAARIPLRAPDREREDRVLRERFAGDLARDRARAMVDRAAEWRPDVVVCDEVDFGSMLAAEELGLPRASVGVIASGSFIRPEVVGGALATRRAERGLAPDPDLAMLDRDLVLSPFPRSLRDPRFPLPRSARSIRLGPVGTGGPAGSPGPWSTARPGAPTVYVTLGTAFTLEAGDLLARCVAGVAALPVNVVATVGTEIDPAEIGPQPDHVHVASFIPQEDVLAHCRVVVSHAGSGSLLGALTYGLPSVLLPLGADQPGNAARAAEVGIATVLDAVHASPVEIGDAVARLLDDPAPRAAAQAMRTELGAAPGPEHAVELIEGLRPR